MNKLEYGRFIKTYHVINDASREVAKLFTRQLFVTSLNLDFWYSDDCFEFSVIHNDVMHTFKLPSDWLVLSLSQVDTILALKTKDELWNYRT